MIFQSDISKLTGLDQPRISRAVTATAVSPAVAPRGPRPGEYRIGDGAKVLVYVRLRSAGIDEATAAEAVKLLDNDVWAELAWRPKPLWLVCVPEKPAVIGDAARVIDYIGEHPSARTVNLQSCLRDVLAVAVERAETPA